MQKTTKDMSADPNCTITVYAGPDPDRKSGVIGFISEWINAYTFVSRKYLSDGVDGKKDFEFLSRGRFGANVVV